MAKIVAICRGFQQRINAAYLLAFSFGGLVRQITTLTTLAGSMTSTARLSDVKGEGDKANDVIVCQDWSKSAASHIIYFGGDVQDYRENMEKHRDNHRYVSWNLESTAELLHKKYPGSLVSVVKPCRMHLHTFSVFSNFVESNMFGVPSHNSSQGAWAHLLALHTNILSKLENDGKYHSDAELKDCGSKDVLMCSEPQNRPIHIIGFSKGCVVLNQLLYELQSSVEKDDVRTFVERVKSITWLDGGHSGGSNTWITDDEVLEEFKKTGIRVFVHVTPYQVKDPMRQWIGKEEKKFVGKIRKLGMNVREILHFSDQKGCLEDHFEVIRMFTNL